MKVTFNLDKEPKFFFDDEPKFRFDLQLFADGDDDGDNGGDADDIDIDDALANDPDLRLVLEEDDDEDEDDLDLDDDEDEDKPRKKAKKRPVQREQEPVLDEATRRVIEDIKANPDKYKRQEQQQIIVPKNPEPDNDQIDVAGIAKAFGADMLSNPEEAGRKIVATMLKLNQQTEARVRREVTNEFSSVASSTARSNVERAARTFDKHPAMTSEVREVFDGLVEQAITQHGAAVARMPQAEIAKGLESAFAEAIGRAAMNSKGRKRPASSPTYAPRSGGAARTQERRMPTLTQDERRIIKNMREGGISEKDIKAAIREIRAEDAEATG